MKPVRTAESNMVYTGPSPEIGDLHCQRIRPGVINSVWWFTPEERAAIAKGANLSLTVLGEPIPPMSVNVIWSPGIGEDAPELLERVIQLREKA